MEVTERETRRRDLEADLARMRAVTQFCQQEAMRVKDPRFQAIVGLMHEYIGLCGDGLAQSVEPADLLRSPVLAVRGASLERRLATVFGGWFEIEVRSQRGL